MFTSTYLLKNYIEVDVLFCRLDYPVDFFYKLSKVLFFVGDFHFVFWLLYCCIAVSYFYSLLIVNPHALPIDIGITIEPKPPEDNVIEVDVVYQLILFV